MQQLQNNNLFDHNFEISNFNFKIDFNLLSKSIIKKFEDLFILKKKVNFIFIDKSLEIFFILT